MTIIINIVGAPAAGKSTLASELFVYLKKKHIDAEYIHEYVKNLVWQNKLEKINDQFYIARNQYKIMSSVVKKIGDNGVIICDSPFVLSAFYNQYNPDNMSNVDKTKDFIFEKLSEFNALHTNLYIFLKRDETIPYSNIGRIHDMNQSQEIENQLQQFMVKNSVNYYTFKTGDDIKNMMTTLGVNF